MRGQREGGWKCRATLQIQSKLEPFASCYLDYTLKAEKYNKLIDEYRLRSDWEKFVLI